MSYRDSSPKAHTLFPSEESLAAEARSQQDREQLRRSKQEIPTHRHKEGEKEKEGGRRQLGAGVAQLVLAVVVIPVLLTYVDKSFSVTSYLVGLGVAAYFLITHYSSTARRTS